MNNSKSHNISLRVEKAIEEESDDNSGSLTPKTIFWIALLIVCSLAALLAVYCSLVRWIYNASRWSHIESNQLFQRNRRIQNQTNSNTQASTDATPNFGNGCSNNATSNTAIIIEDTEGDRSTKAKLDTSTCDSYNICAKETSIA